MAVLMCVQSFVVANYFVSCLTLNVERIFDRNPELVDETISKMTSGEKIIFAFKITVSEINEKYSNCITEPIERKLRAHVCAIAKKSRYGQDHMCTRYEQELLLFLQDLFVKHKVFSS